MSTSFMRKEGGFTTPAAALAILVACSLAFACTRVISIESRSAQIQYVADAAALAADNAVAQFVTYGQVIDAASLSFSLTGLSLYAASAVAAFIPGGQGAAAEIASMGSKVFQTRDRFMDSAVKGLNAAQKALPAICAVRASQVIQSNADASGIPYAGTAIASPLESEEIALPDDSEAREAARSIEEKEARIQEESLKQQEAQERENEAKERAWRADCGNSGMSMYERANKLSNISAARNPYYSSPERWSFSVALARAKSYYAARYEAEAGSSYGSSPELIGQSVARKRFYSYALEEVSKGYVETSASGAEIPHLMQLARNTNQIKSTSLYSESIYPVSKNGDALFLHAYAGCPTCIEGDDAGCASVSSIDAGTTARCPTCNFSATTLGRVPSASTSISNGFEYHYLAVVEASRDYAKAVEDARESRDFLAGEQESISNILSEAASSLSSKRYDPQPPGRYGCVCIVAAPSEQSVSLPFINDGSQLSERIAISGATLAPDEASDQSNVIKSVADGLIPSGQIASPIAKTAFTVWGDLLTIYSNGTDSIKTGMRKLLGAIPLVGNALSDKAASAFEGALSAAGLEPADLSAYKPVLVNTSLILERDGSPAAAAILNLKKVAQAGDYAAIGDLSSLIDDIVEAPTVQDLLDEHGLALASIPLADIGLGNANGTLYLPVPADLYARIKSLRSALSNILGG